MVTPDAILSSNCKAGNHNDCVWSLCEDDCGHLDRLGNDRRYLS